MSTLRIHVGGRFILPKWTVNANGQWVQELRTVVLSNDGKIIRETSRSAR